MFPTVLILLLACTDAVTQPDTAAAADTGDTSVGDTAETGDTADTADSAETGDTADTGETGDTAVPLAPPCAAYGTPVPMGTVAEATLDELSGIAVSRRDPDVLWVHEDHAGEPAVYALDPAGNLLATVNLAGATNNDWEDLSVAPCDQGSCIWIGEVGNNQSDRVGLGVYRIPEPDLADVVDGVLDVEPTFYGFVYPDMNQNSEAIAVTAAGVPVVFTKRFDDESSRVYTYPSLDASVEAALTYVGTFATGDEGAEGAASVTAADFWPDDSRVLVRTYGAIFELDTSGGLATLDGAARTTVIGAHERQGEAIGYDPGRRGFWQVAEGPNPTLWFTGCAPEEE